MRAGNLLPESKWKINIFDSQCYMKNTSFESADPMELGVLEQT